MSGCTVFVFLSLMEYALVNIVMGDIADIEKKKNSGLSHLLLGVRGPNMGVGGGVKTQKSFHTMQDMGGMGAMGMSTHDAIENKDHEVRVKYILSFSLVDSLAGWMRRQGKVPGKVHIQNFVFFSWRLLTPYKV